MKKLKLMMVLCIVAILTLTACQGKKTESTDNSVAETEKTESTDNSVTETDMTESTDNSITETDKATVNLKNHSLMIYCGAGMKNPFDEITAAFKEQTSCEVAVTYANAGQIQSQITTAKEGDLFIAGSSEELAPVKDYISESKELVKHIPVLAVQKGNPKNIKGLSDLTQEGVQMVLGDNEATPIGKIGDKALKDAGILESVNIVARTTTAPALATALEAGEADATIIWKENAKKIEIVDTTDLDAYIKTVPAASLNFNNDNDALKAFLEFLDSDDAKNIWKNYGYELVD